MTIHEAYQQTLLQLYHRYDDRESANITDLLLEHVTGFRKIDRIMNRQALVSFTQQTRMEELLEQLKAGRPVQYVLGECWFGDLKFEVNESVLIPRPETEELVDWILKDHPQKETEIYLLDIGTGSGCIPITVKHKKPLWHVTALEVSTDALHLAQRNATINQLKVDFRQLDFLNAANWKSLRKFDIIVSNPPYIKKNEATSMHENVLAYEPHLALFVDDEDPLIFYRNIAVFGCQHLSAGGAIYVEINESLGAATADVFQAQGYSCEICTDMQGKERMIKAKRRE